MKQSRILRGALLSMAVLAPVAMATTFTVNTTADSGAGSLRDAINLANVDPAAPVIIQFAIPAGGGVATIQPLTPLPIIQNANGLGITINGYTQPGSSFTSGNTSSLVITVELDGSLIPTPYVPPPPPADQFAHGLHIMSSDNIVQGLCVHSFPHDGISIQGIPLAPPDPPQPSGANNNQIRWNMVGTDVAGMVAMPNGHDPGSLWGGIYVKVLPGSPGIANGNIILENVASGNTYEGIGLANCPDAGSDVAQNHVERNYVGIDISGTNTNLTVGNGRVGIYIGEGANNNALDQNWVANNGYSGVSIVGYGPSGLSTHTNTLIYNRIGVDVNLNPMGNVRHGVAIGSYGGAVWGWAPNNLVTSNTIAHNGLAGIAVDEDASVTGDQDTSFNTITQNAIYLNGLADPGQLGIDLAYEPTLPRPPGGVTANDGGDGDNGPNDLINFPVITSAVFNSGTTTVSGTLDIAGSPANVEVFRAVLGNYSNHGQGASYLGNDTSPTATWSVALTGGALPGQLLTATATDGSGNTSEFSANVPVWDENQQPDDYGDAPNTYLTLAASGGPVHTIVGGMYLGASVDGEPDGQPNANASGDDLDGNDDEDGVVFPNALVPGQTGQVDITASQIGLIDAWIDFDGSPPFNAGADQILSNASHPGGGVTISYNFTVPAGASPGITTVARVRYSTAGNTLPTGPANDGEVEDHEVTIDEGQGTELDWGDAPDQPYRTLAVNGGPSHPIATDPISGTTICLGNSVDSEGNGQPDPNALGDDNDGNDDEDGVVFNTPLIPGQSATITVTASVAGFLDAWIDYDQSGTFGDQANELIYSGAVVAGANPLGINVPAGAASGTSFARFRYNTTSTGLSPAGQAFDGEVEDYEVTLEDEPDQLDFGDAPDGAAVPVYPTLLANNGARHVIGGPILGTVIDADPNGQPTTNADGDDNDGTDDEDGIAFPSAIISGVPTTIQVNSSTGGILQGWIDWNDDGDWADASEQIITDTAVPAGATTITFSVPSAATGGADGVTYARFRISTQAGLGYIGLAPDGEVEDYPVRFEPLKWLQIPEQGEEGVDVAFHVDETQHILADDFLCTASGPITDIHLWGSFLSDNLPIEGPDGLTFEISIWSDVPAGVDAAYSHPGEQLWEMEFAPGQYAAAQIWHVDPGEWWHDPGTQNWVQWADQGIYQFDFYPPEGEEFVQEEGTIYWLAVKYRYDGVGWTGRFGWKTTPEPWNDDAVYDDMASPVGWTDMFYQQPHPWWDPAFEMESVNLAFALSGEEEPQEEIDWGDAPDLVLGTGPGDYETTGADNGAFHPIVAQAPYFDDGAGGDAPDAEPDGQQDPGALGDDNDYLSAVNDDEDGVSIPNPLTVGVPATITLSLSASGWVDAFVDWNADGDWTDSGETVFSGVMTSGTNTIPVTPPIGSVPGQTFARFRVHSNDGAALPPTGGAPDGEVEDHLVDIEEEPAEVDWGDAPDPLYPTLSSSSGANHTIVAGMFLGGLVDGDPNGQPDPTATGDDNDGTDDEDGVAFYPMASGSFGTVDIVASMPGMIDAWIDFNQNGSWLDPGEQVLTSAAANTGSNQYTFSVSAGALAGQTFARVRYSSAGGLTPTGSSPDGEVEDHIVDVRPEGEELYDFGDALDPPYPTLVASDGARHLLAGGPILGSVIDAELDGQPTPAADGDDLLDGNDDEEGIGFPYPLIVGQPSAIAVTASAPGLVDGWIDVGGDGVWGPGDQVLVSVPVGPGVNYLPIVVPGGAGGGTTAARFRISSVGGLAPTGAAMDGEVEDYMVEVSEEGAGLDFGDAPDPGYPTVMLSNGAAHSIDSLFLGTAVDAEPDGQPTGAADGDDLAGATPDDEDGVVFTSPLIGGRPCTITVTASAPGLLDAWFDVDGDGTWTQADNHVIPAFPVVAGANPIVFTMPTTANPLVTFARFRISHAGTTHSGFTAGGEVEDYQVTIGWAVRATASHTTSPATLVLTWPTIGGTSYYTVYSSTNLATSFPIGWTLETPVPPGVTGLTWSEAISVPRKFYAVVAWP